MVAWEPIGNRAPTAAMTSYRCGFRTCSGQRSRRIRCGNRCGNHCGNRRQTTIHAGTGEARSQREWGHMQHSRTFCNHFVNSWPSVRF